MHSRGISHRQIIDKQPLINLNSQEATTMSNSYPKWHGVDYLVSYILDPVPGIPAIIDYGYVVSIYSKWDFDECLVHNLRLVPGVIKFNLRFGARLHPILDISIMPEQGSTLDDLLPAIELEITDFEERKAGARA